MTFTRKAAAEMKERVLKALEQAKQNTPVRGGYDQRTRELALAALANDHARDWRLLSDPSQLQIQTIDSLCATLTRQMPLFPVSADRRPSRKRRGTLHAGRAADLTCAGGIR